MENELLDEKEAPPAWLRSSSAPAGRYLPSLRKVLGTICSPAKAGVRLVNLSVRSLPVVASSGEMLAHAARRLDAHLRKKQGIFEFCDNPHCLLRVALHRAEVTMILGHGVHLLRGGLVAELHLWNEHIPRIPGAGPNFSWAVLAQRRMRQSLGFLADHVRSDPRFGEVRIFHAHALFGSGKSQARMQRFAKLHGFELTHAQVPASWLGRLRNLGECLHQWAMIRAFNPGALTGRQLINVTHHQLWISREALLAKFPGSQPKPPAHPDRPQPASTRPLAFRPRAELS
jgi:hypothetical protein